MKKTILLLAIIMAFMSCEKDQTIENDSYWIYLGVVKDYNHEFIDDVQYKLMSGDEMIEQGFIDTLTKFELINNVEYDFLFNADCFKPTSLNQNNDCNEFRVYVNMEYELDTTSIHYCKLDTLIIRE